MNKKTSGIIFAVIMFLLILVAGIFLTDKYIFSKPLENNDQTSIKIGWQTAWIPQAQLVQTLKHTDLLKDNFLAGDFKGFSYGAPLSEAALAGEVDVFFAADLPSITLMAKSEKWSMVGRLMDFRNGIIVPANSSLNSLQDLRDKTISVPFNSSPHVHLLKALKDNNLSVNIDYKLVNLDILEQSSIVQNDAIGKWNNIDAFGSWDPTIALAEETKKAKILQLFEPVSVIMMSNDFITKNPDGAKNFLKSFAEAYLYYANNQQTVNQWFADEAKFKQSFAILDKAASLEKNLKAKKLSDIDLNLYQDHLDRMQDIADLAKENDLIKNSIDIQKRYNNKPLQDAIKETNNK